MSNPLVNVLSFLATAGLLLAPSTTHACSCMPPGSPQEELSTSAAVFIGNVAGMRLDSSGKLFVVTLTVSSYWKGVASSPIEVRTPTHSAACGYDFEPDSSYLVYAFEGESGLHTGLCTRTKDVAHAEFDLAELGPPIVLSTGDAGPAPNHLRLEQNYPNPFNPVTNFQFAIDNRQLVVLTVHDLLGRAVATIVSEELPAGAHTRRWDASGMPSGVYYYRLRVIGLSSANARFEHVRMLAIVR